MPVNLRIVYGKTDPEKTGLTFASSKCHSDFWADVPADATVVILLLFGDIDITIEAGEMPREMELQAMRVMSDFNQGQDIPMVVSYTGAKLKQRISFGKDV